MEQFQYLTVEQIAESDCYPFGMGQMRDHLLRRRKNGLVKAVRKIGRRIYFRKDLFEEWIESKRETEEETEEETMENV